MRPGAALWQATAAANRHSAAGCVGASSSSHAPSSCAPSSALTWSHRSQTQRHALLLSSASPSSSGSYSRVAPCLRRRQSSWSAALNHTKNLVSETGLAAAAAAASALSSSSSKRNQQIQDQPPPPPGPADLGAGTRSTDEGAVPASVTSLPAGHATGSTPASTSASSSSIPRRKSATGSPIRDPLEIVGDELSALRQNVSSLLGSGHPSLDTIAKYYFQAEGKHVRPLIVLLMAKATNGLSPHWEALAKGGGYLDAAHARSGAAPGAGAEVDVDEPLSPREVLNDFNPDMEGLDAAAAPSSAGHKQKAANMLREGSSALSRVAGLQGEAVLPTQRRLAEITEMIHVASLLHDDVIDASALRRGAPSAPAAFGNKLSILGGDFLLGRASVALARLRNNEVVELVATVIANLVEGEVMQLRAQALQQQDGAAKPRKSAFSTFWEGVKSAASPSSSSSSSQQEPASKGPTPEVFEHYLQKTYLKTAALIGKASRAAAILGGHGAEQCATLPPAAQARARAIRDAAYAYGRNVGIAFQLVDDLLDFRATSAVFGKPAGGADLRLGLATAPVLYAWEQHPDSGLGEMVARKFSGEGDVEKALAIVNNSNGLQRTAELARAHAQKASDALLILPQTEARDALIKLNEDIVDRVK